MDGKGSRRSNQCILCDGTEGLKILHKVYRDTSFSYGELLLECFSIHFPDTHRGKYNMVCKQCTESIQFCVDFRKQVEIAHKRLYNKMSAESSINKLFKIDKAEITIKPWKEIKAEPDDEDNNASNTKHIPIHDNTKNLLAAEIETLSKIKEEFEAMDYSDNTDTFHVTHDYSDNNDIFHEENEPESDSSSVKTDEIFRATGYKETQLEEKESFSIPELEPTATQCPLCEKQFLDNKLLNEHYMTHYPAYICHICGMSLMKYAKYKRHLDSHSGFEIQCDLCEKKFKSSTALKAHKDYLHFKQPRICCQHCKEKFTSVEMRNKHKLEVHGIEPTMYKCPTCEWSFHSPCLVKRHVKRTHLKIRDFHCQICFLTFFDSTELKFHVEAKHEGKRSHKCEICNRTYSYLGGLRLHQKNHHSRKGYECQVCGGIFGRQTHLKHHLKTHEPSE